MTQNKVRKGWLMAWCSLCVQGCLGAGVGMDSRQDSRERVSFGDRTWVVTHDSPAFGSPSRTKGPEGREAEDRGPAPPEGSLPPSGPAAWLRSLGPALLTASVDLIAWHHHHGRRKAGMWPLTAHTFLCLYLTGQSMNLSSSPAGTQFSEGCFVIKGPQRVPGRSPSPPQSPPSRRPELQ